MKKKGVTLIDYGLATVLMAPTLLGAQIGATLLTIFPPMILTILLTVTLFTLSILLSTTATFIFNWSEVHPEKPHVNVIDYGLTSIMMPTTLAGAQIGSLILIAFPSLWIQIALTIMLALLCW